MKDGWSLYRDLHAIALDLGIHTSCAGNLAASLWSSGVDTLAQASEMSLCDLEHVYRIGPRTVELAHAVGMKGSLP